MRSARVAATVFAAWMLAAPFTARTEDQPAAQPTAPVQETERSSTLQAVYFPFLALGHGIFAIGEYVIGYPLYYLSKPAIDFLYGSSEDPTDYPNSRR
jgi:hypothetical protein